MHSNAKLLPFRSNIPYLAEFCLTPSDPDFPKRAKEKGGGFIVAGANYGQGSSREHAALAPLQLGVKAVMAVSFARIHMANLINNGIIPLEFADENDYKFVEAGDCLCIENAKKQIESMQGYIEVTNRSKNKKIKTILDISERQTKILIAGGLLNFTKQRT